MSRSEWFYAGLALQARSLARPGKIGRHLTPVRLAGPVAGLAQRPAQPRQACRRTALSRLDSMRLESPAQTGPFPNQGSLESRRGYADDRSKCNCPAAIDRCAHAARRAREPGRSRSGAAGRQPVAGDVSALGRRPPGRYARSAWAATATVGQHGRTPDGDRCTLSRAARPAEESTAGSPGLHNPRARQGKRRRHRPGTGGSRLRRLGRDGGWRGRRRFSGHGFSRSPHDRLRLGRGHPRHLANRARPGRRPKRAGRPELQRRIDPPGGGQDQRPRLPTRPRHGLDRAADLVSAGRASGLSRRSSAIGERVWHDLARHFAIAHGPGRESAAGRTTPRTTCFARCNFRHTPRPRWDRISCGNTERSSIFPATGCCWFAAPMPCRPKPT